MFYRHFHLPFLDVAHQKMQLFFPTSACSESLGLGKRFIYHAAPYRLWTHLRSKHPLQGLEVVMVIKWTLEDTRIVPNNRYANHNARHWVSSILKHLGWMGRIAADPLR